MLPFPSAVVVLACGLSFGCQTPSLTGKFGAPGQGLSYVYLNLNGMSVNVKLTLVFLLGVLDFFL